MVDYINFLPNYPAYNDDQFQQKLFNKEEFYRLKLSREQEKIESSGFLKHQMIVQRFMSGHTDYDGILLFHEMGTGKTCAAYAIARALQDSGHFKRCYIYARGTDLLANIMRSFVFSCSKDYDIDRTGDPKLEMSAVRRALKKFFSFDTFLKTARFLATLSDEKIIDMYSNSVIIVDEIHNIKADERIAKEAGVNVYEQFHRLFHLPFNCKKVIMSGTPMTDDVNEIADIMNLLLPNENQLPVGKEFEKRFLTELNDGTLVPSEEGEKELRAAFRGKISYLLAAADNVEIIFQGKQIQGAVSQDIPQFRVETLVMYDFQSAAYEKAYKKDSDSKEGGIYGNSRQASLFVFPDGSWGEEGLSKFAVKRKNDFTLKPDFKAVVRQIDGLRELSVKYASTISAILDNPNKNIYVYGSIVNGSGVKLLAKILELYGFERCTGREVMPGRRYILLTGDTQNIGSLVKYFNSERNVNGRFCQVVIGSRKISEGFSFHNVQLEILLTFHWNYTETAQALKRGARYNSFAALLKQTGGPIRQIVRQFAAVPKKRYETSVDYLMIQFSIRKDVSIKRMERICQEAAVDCPLNYERNVGDVENSRECNYMACEYKCDTSQLARTSNDFSTYELYYSNYLDLVPRIVQQFHTHDSFGYESLIDIIRPENEFQLLKALAHIIETNIVIYNSYNYPCYLRELDNRYYLVETKKFTTNYLSNYITMPLFSEEKLLSDRVAGLEVQRATIVLDDMFQSPPRSVKQVMKYMDKLPVSIRIRFIQAAITKSIESKKVSNITALILTAYEEKIYFHKSGEFVATFDSPRGTFCARRSDPSSWVQCKVRVPGKAVPITEDTQEDASFEEMDTKAAEAEINYVGIVGDSDKFCIKDLSKAGGNIDKRKNTTGAVCVEAGWSKARLIELSKELKIGEPQEGWEKSRKADLCANIRAFLDTKGLVSKGKCGTARKLKGK